MSIATPELNLDADLALMARTVNTCRTYVANFERRGTGNAGSIHDVLKAVRTAADKFSDDYAILGELVDEMTTWDVPDMVELLREYISMFSSTHPTMSR